MAVGDTFALDHVDSHRRSVEQNIDQVVVEKVDLVDVEDVPIGLGEHAGLEALSAGALIGSSTTRMRRL